MPELPEVETIRRGLLEVLPGRRIGGVEETEPFMLLGLTTDDLADAVSGRLVEDVRRHGKFLFVVLSGDLYLTLHLGMTGQVTVRGDGELPPHTRFVFALEGRGTGLEDAAARLVFRDVRKFGRVEIGWGGPPARTLAMGPDALEGSWTSTDLARMLAGRRAPLKAFLLDQRRLAGIGNIYADEILFATRLDPRRPAGSLTEDEVVRLTGEIRSRLAEGVRLKGCSISDFVDASGRPGRFQQVLQAYGRQGEPCPRCGTPLERVWIAGRGSAFCPVCQS